MSIFRFLGLNARHQRSQGIDNEDSSSLNCGRWDSYKTALLSEHPEPLAAVWLEASGCKHRFPISSTASTARPNARPQCKFLSSSAKSIGKRFCTFDYHHQAPPQLSHLQSGPGQRRNFSNISLPVIQKTQRVKLKEVVKQTRRDVSADDTLRAPEPLTPSKFINIPPKYPRAQLSTPKSSLPHHPILRCRTQSLSCLRAMRGPNHTNYADEKSEMLSAAFFLPKLSMDASLLSPTTTLGKNEDPDANSDAYAWPAAIVSVEGCSSPSTRRPHSERARFSQTHTPSYPAGFQTSQPPTSEYHRSAVAHEDEIIQDPCYPEESDHFESGSGFRFPSSGRLDMCPATHSSPRPLTCHSPSGSHFSFISIDCSPKNFSCSQVLATPYTASEPQRHLIETETNQMNSHLTGSQSDVRSLAQHEHLESLRSTNHAYPSMIWSSAKLRSFPSFGHESRSGSDSVASASDEHRRATHFACIENPLQAEPTIQPLSPYQRDMLDIMAVHGESLFKSPVSTELTIEKNSLPRKESSRESSTRSSIQKNLTDKIGSKTSQRSPSFTQGRIGQDFPLSFDTFVGSRDKTHNANSRPAKQSEKAGLDHLPSAPREPRFRKPVLSARPSTAIPTTIRATEFVRRLSQSSKNRPFAERLAPDMITSKQEKFEALLKASDASQGGTLKLSLSTKIDSLDESLSAPPTFLPQLRLSCDFFSSTPTRSSDRENGVNVDPKLMS